MLTAGTALGKYKILRLLGTGGMADVYEAEDQQLGRRVALKVLPPEFARDPKAVARFEKEVRAAASLNHASIVTIFEVDHAENLHFCAMRLLTGGDLRARIDKGLSQAQALEIMREITGAFVHAHNSGFVHRDVKPENILFDEQGRAILTDFGIAKAMSSESKMTATGVSIGTPRYISPEQARGLTVDGRADIYSLGVIFYEMLTGKLPFLAEDSLAIIFMHVTEPIPRLPAPLARFQGLVDALMAKEPSQRPATADEVLKLLRAFADVAPPPPPVAPPPPRPHPADNSNATIVTGEREFAQKLVQEEERQRVEASRRSGKLSDEVIAAAVAATPPPPPEPPKPTSPPPPPPQPRPAPAAAPAARTASSAGYVPRAVSPSASGSPSAAGALPTATFGQQSRGSSKGPLMVIGGVALILIGIALFWMIFSGSDDDESEAGDEVVAQVEAAAGETASDVARPVASSAAVSTPAGTSAAEIVEPSAIPVATAAAATAAPVDQPLADAEKKRKAALEAKRSSAANKSKTATAAVDSGQLEIDRTKRFAKEKASCKRHVSDLFPGWEFTYADMAKYPGAKKSPDGSIETPELSDDYGALKRYIIDVNGCIVGVID
jgi:serine/threonine protein kinase